MQVFVLTQFKLTRWWNICGRAGGFQDSECIYWSDPAQMQTGKKWYEGTADAIYQNLNLIYDSDAI